MKIFEIKINNETTYTVDTDKYQELYDIMQTKITNDTDDIYYLEIEILKSYEYVPKQFELHVTNKCSANDFLAFVTKYNQLKENIEQYYNDLDYPDEIELPLDYFDFSDPEYFFNTYFDSPYDAVQAVFFGNVHWHDNYIRFNAYANLETVYAIPFNDYQDEIIGQWLHENF